MGIFGTRAARCFKYIDSFNQLRDEYVKQLVLNIIYVLHKRAQPEQLIESYRHYLIGKFSTNRGRIALI